MPPITSIEWEGPLGSPLSNTVGGKYRVNGGTLTVTALSSDDSGNYSCVAGNSEGDTNGTANLVVLGEYARVCVCVCVCVCVYVCVCQTACGHTPIFMN